MGYRKIRKLKKDQPDQTGDVRTLNSRVSYQTTLEEFKDSADLFYNTIPHLNLHFILLKNIANEKKIQMYLVDPFENADGGQVQDILSEKMYMKSNDPDTVYNAILSGQAAIFFRDQAHIVDVFGPETRAVNESGTESVISGPHEAFNESAGKSISLIRRRIKSTRLKVVKLKAGEVTKTDIYLLYIEGLVNTDMLSMLKKRITSIEIDGVFDTNMLVQMIDDNPFSLFPQFLTTERPDAASSKLIEGKIIGITDGSPYAFIAPTSIFEFFNSPDDYYQRWAVATALRVLRYSALFITIFLTAFYVALTTFHYEMIPTRLLITLMESRSKVPFPPIYEAMLLEFTIELLREAGARLPTKIGQTIGIVGGIVIGQAAVQAGFTSNILIISVALSAVASFVVPSYIMSSSIRIIRFLLIFMAGIWGNYGIMVGLSMILIHLSGVKSLSTSYLTPLAPFFGRDLRDIVFRAPFSLLKTRPAQERTPNSVRTKRKI
ncbi:spore germination protein [Peribacillus sp. SCS-26]|uniref:spore germination protein n=1 Tax=Paraperibacillus marinus TaxID=3115295 RepID=UPI003906362B